MSFTRLKYDNCACQEATARSVGPMHYRLFGGHVEHCNLCHSFTGPRNSKEDVSTTRENCELGHGSMIAVESELQNRVNPSSQCNKVGKNNGHKDHDANIKHKDNCGVFLDEQDTRFSHPLDNYRGMTIDRFEHLPIDPQCNIFWNNSINSRLVAKDTYRMIRPELLTNTPFPVELPSNENTVCSYKCEKK